MYTLGKIGRDNNRILKKFNADSKAKIIARSRAVKEAIGRAKARDIELTNKRNRIRAAARRRARERDRVRAENFSMVLTFILGIPIILIAGTVYFVTWPVHTGLRKAIRK